MAFTCQVCFEEKSERLSLPTLRTGNGDVLRADDCQHPICQACLAAWVTTRVEEQRVCNVRCPFVGCTNRLFEQDVSRLAQTGALSTSTFEHFTELLARDFTARAKALSEALKEVLEKEKDFDVVQRIGQTMRLCPRCSLAIERSEGCNSFYCTCGHHFDFATAPRLLGNNLKNYIKVIDAARSLCLSLEDAEKYGGDSANGKEWSSGRAFAAHRVVSRISAETGKTMDEAWELHQKAKSGDKDARRMIRTARGRANTTTEEPEDEEVPCTLFSDNAPSQAENYHVVPQDVQNMTDGHAEEHAAEEEIRMNTQDLIAALGGACVKAKKKNGQIMAIQNSTVSTDGSDIINSD